MAELSKLVLLGPQRFEPTVADTLQSVGAEGQDVAVVTAGWQERESEIEELSDHVDCPVHHLELYRRYAEILQEDAELAEALHRRQNRMKEIQTLYRIQLEHELNSVGALQEKAGIMDVQDHLRGAIRNLKSLDRRHLTRMRATHKAFDEEWKPQDRPSVRRHREAVAELLRPCSALLIAGGHVATLVNRLRLFALDSMLGGKVAIAWSAGAMAISERIVLFHDSPPQGAGNAEILDSGLRWHSNIVALPHARQRLRLEDRDRISRMARRFSPARCVLLDRGARLDWTPSGVSAGKGTRRLTRAGRVREFGR